MAPPSSVVFADLEANFAYIDLRSGTAWDIFFLGYGDRRWGRFPQSAKKRSSDKFFSPWKFLTAIDEISARHRQALAEADETPPGVGEWRYSGTCDLVSLMAYGDPSAPSYSVPPVHWDWLSLRGVTLTDAYGKYVDHGLGEVVETLSDWRKDPPDLDRFAPGEAPAIPVLDLNAALTAVASAAAGGVVGGAAYDLL